MEKVTDTIIKRITTMVLFAFIFVGLGVAVDYLRFRYMPIDYWVNIESIQGEDMVLGETEQDFIINRDVNIPVRSELLRELNLRRSDREDSVCRVEVDVLFQDIVSNQSGFTVYYTGENNCNLEVGEYYWIFTYCFPELQGRCTVIRGNSFSVTAPE